MSLAWDVFRQMEHLRREMDSLLSGDVLTGRVRPGFRWSFLPGLAARGYPLLNVSEDDENVYVDALAPGLDADSLDINVVGDQLSISGEKPALSEKIKADAYHRNERAAGSFVRTLTLPSAVDQDKAGAGYANGVLTISLPKVQEAKPKQITVNVH